MLVVKDEMKGIEIDVTLNPRQKAVLSSYVKQEGWDIIQLLMEDVVRRFNLKLINTSVEKREDVLANHALAKAAAQFYAGLMSRLNEELNIEAFNNRVPNPDNPETSTEIPELA